MRPVGKCAHCGADTFLGSLVIGPGQLGSQPVYCATEGCVAAAFSEGLGAWLKEDCRHEMDSESPSRRGSSAAG